MHKNNGQDFVKRTLLFLVSIYFVKTCRDMIFIRQFGLMPFLDKGQTCIQ
jgi:hypothetical protein